MGVACLPGLTDGGLTGCRGGGGSGIPTPRFRGGAPAALVSPGGCQPYPRPITLPSRSPPDSRLDGGGGETPSGNEEEEEEGGNKTLSPDHLLSLLRIN